MSEISREQFELGKKLLGEDNIDKALRAFEKAYKADKNNPDNLSYYGLCKALRSGEIGLGIELCTAAIKKEFHRPEYYLNLGRIYLAAGNKKSAVKVFKKGLKFAPESAELHKELADLGFRNKPVIQALERSNPINKYLGILLRRTLPSLFGNKKKKAGPKGHGAPSGQGRQAEQARPRPAEQVKQGGQRKPSEHGGQARPSEQGRQEEKTRQPRPHSRPRTPGGPRKRR